MLAATLSGFNAWRKLNDEQLLLLHLSLKVCPVSKDQSPASLSEVDGVFYEKMNLISHLLWITALSAVTHSVLTFYWRIFKDQIKERNWRGWFWSSIAVVFVWWFTSVGGIFYHMKGKLSSMISGHINTLC